MQTIHCKGHGVLYRPLFSPRVQCKLELGRGFVVVDEHLLGQIRVIANVDRHGRLQRCEDKVDEAGWCCPARLGLSHLGALQAGLVGTQYDDHSDTVIVRLHPANHAPASVHGIARCAVEDERTPLVDCHQKVLMVDEVGHRPRRRVHWFALAAIQEVNSFVRIDDGKLLQRRQASKAVLSLLRLHQIRLTAPGRPHGHDGIRTIASGRLLEQVSPHSRNPGEINVGQRQVAKRKVPHCMCLFLADAALRLVARPQPWCVVNSTRLVKPPLFEPLVHATHELPHSLRGFRFR